MLENLNTKQKISIIIILVLMVCVIVYYIYTVLGKAQDYDLIEENSTISDSLVDDKKENFNIENDLTVYPEEKTILIHVSGQVKNNTVVELPAESRIKDAIEAAGGLTKEADLTNINLAYILEDGEKIYIPKKGEKIDEEDVGVVGVGQTETSAPTVRSSSLSNKSSKININKATQTELESLPGVGPSTAQKIIAYREESGKFTSVEDIKNVSGIGSAKYEKMKEFISVK